MTKSETIANTTELLTRLTEKLGLPLPDLVQQKRLPETVAAQMAQNCTRCPHPSKCQNYLAAQPDKLENPPGFCANARLLTFLGNTLTKPP